MYRLMTETRRRYEFCIVLLICCTSRSVSQSIPLGTLFDNSSVVLDSALRHAIDQYNRGSDSITLHRISNTTDGADSFTISSALCSQLSQGVFAIVGLTNSSSAATIRSYAAANLVPYITTSMVRRTDNLADFLIHIRPEYTVGLLDVIKYYGWNHVYYIYISDEGMLRLQLLFRILNQDEDYELDIDPRRVFDAETGYHVLRQIYRIRGGDTMHVVLDMKTQDVQKILDSTVNDRNVSRGYFHYLTTDLGLMDLDLSNFQFGGINLTGFQLVDFNNASNKHFFDEWANLNPEIWPGAGQRRIQFEAALVIDAVHLFARAMSFYYREFGDYTFKYNRKDTVGVDKMSAMTKQCSGETMNNAHYGRHLLNMMKKKVKFNGYTGSVSIDDNGMRKDFSLSVMEVNVNRGPAKIGLWSSNDGLILNKQPQIYRKENGSARLVQRVVTILSKPYVMLKTESTDGKPLTGNNRYKGYCIDLANLVSEKIGFEYVIHLVKDNTYGAKENKTWNGIIGELVNNEADIGIADLTITAIRERAVDFTKPFMSLGITIMIKRPEEASPGVFSFMDPLSYEIWMCILFAYTGVSVVLFLVSRFSPSEWYVEDESNISNDFSISNSFWFALGAFMQQGCEISPRSLSGRIAGCVWWFFTLIIISSYTANLAAFLTVERMSTPIESAEDLVKQTIIKYGTLQSGATNEFFRTSEVALYQRMYAYMSAQPNVFVKTIFDGIERVRNGNGKYAVLLESTTIDYYNHKEPCDTIKVGSNLDSKGFGIATPVGSDLRDLLTLAVLSLRESGKLTQMFNEWWNKSRGCGNIDDKLEQGATQNSLNLQNVAGIFFILIGGLILAVITAFSEFMYKSQLDSRRTKTTFGSALRSKARLSFRGHSEDGSIASPYRYSLPPQMGGADGYSEPNPHTQV